MKPSTFVCGAVWLASLALLSSSCSKDNEIDQSTNVNSSCTTPATDLAKLCPPGTAVDITGTSAVGDVACPSGEGEVKDAQGKTTGVCRTLAGCSVRCKATCECGVKSATTTSVECAPCATCKPGDVSCSGDTLLLCGPDGKQAPTDCAKAGQVCSSSLGQCVAAGKCGNGVCEKEEDETKCPADCKKDCGDGVCSGVETAASCPEDCVKATCGNKKCEAGESPASCPQDCDGGTKCTPNAKYCVGPLLFICQPDGADEKKFNCGDFEQTCGNGACVPTDQCGNGACEPTDPPGCADCATTCGNGTCEPDAGETFETCGNDCKKAACGDKVCSPSETGASCPQDCAATCGSKLPEKQCEAGESRATCPIDCGYCGDGACDANETALLQGEGGPEYCPQDCVQSGKCTQASDCNDGSPCTKKDCVNGECKFSVPTPASEGCGAGMACVLGFGCCADADGDGFGCCGGSGGKGCVNPKGECDDNDKETHPGAPEFCDGVDRNCNGSNKPALDAAPKQLTSDPTSKFALGVGYDGERYLLAWQSKPDGSPAVVTAVVDKTGAVSAPTTLTKLPEERPQLIENFNGRTEVAYSPKRKDFAVAWQVAMTANDHRAAVSWVSTENKPDGSPLFINHLPDLSNTLPIGESCQRRAQLLWVDGVYLFSVCTNNGGAVHNPIMQLLTENKTLKTTTPLIGGYHVFSAHKGNFVSITEHVHIRGLSTSGQLALDNTLSWGAFSPPGLHNPAWWISTSAGAHVVLLSETATINNELNGIRFSAVTEAGTVIASETISTLPVSPEDVVYAPDAKDPSKSKVGVLAREGDNLYVGVYTPTGKEILPLSLVGGGPQLARARLVWDGASFVALWTSAVNNLLQVHSSKLSCE